MKKNKDTFITITVVLLYIVIYIIFKLICANKIYSTPEEALMKKENLKREEVIAVLRDGEYAVGIYQGSSHYLKSVKNGWKILHNDVFFYQDINVLNDYIICHYKDNGNHLIYISTIIEEEEKAITPTDSLNSNFQTYRQDEIAGFSICHWFLVLDDLPENYTITIGDKFVQIK